MERNVITDYLDSYLEIGSFIDDSANGLQVENSGNVDRIGLAVDACHESITKAAQAGCNLLVVHHGLYWGRQELVLDHLYQRIRDLIIADMALYTAHIPLDAHPEIGHNRVIAEQLELVEAEPFALYHGRAIGVKGRFKKPISRTEAASDVEKVIGCRQGFLTFGPSNHLDRRHCRRLGHRYRTFQGIETGGDRSLHHRRAETRRVSPGPGIRAEHFLWRPLPDGNVRDEGAGRASS